MTGDRLWRYALTQPGRDPLFLPGSTKPGQVGYARNLTIDQPPGSEVTFTLGDGMRQIGPLTLTGTIIPTDLQEPTEAAARIYLRELDEYARECSGIQRDLSITRSLHSGTGVFTAQPGSTPLTWNFTLTLLPTGPAWLDADGYPVPF